MKDDGVRNHSTQRHCVAISTAPHHPVNASAPTCTMGLQIKLNFRLKTTTSWCMSHATPAESLRRQVFRCVRDLLTQSRYSVLICNSGFNLVSLAMSDHLNILPPYSPSPVAVPLLWYPPFPNSPITPLHLVLSYFLPSGLNPWGQLSQCCPVPGCWLDSRPRMAPCDLLPSTPRHG